MVGEDNSPSASPLSLPQLTASTSTRTKPIKYGSSAYVVARPCLSQESIEIGESRSLLDLCTVLARHFFYSRALRLGVNVSGGNVMLAKTIRLRYLAGQLTDPKIQTVRGFPNYSCLEHDLVDAVDMVVSNLHVSSTEMSKFIGMDEEVVKWLVDEWDREMVMQCSCGGGTRDKTSNKLDKERGVRVIIEWSECTSCGRTLVTDRREEKNNDDK